MANLYCTDDFKATEGNLAGVLCTRFNEQVDTWERTFSPDQTGKLDDSMCGNQLDDLRAAANERIRQWKSGVRPGGVAPAPAPTPTPAAEPPAPAPAPTEPSGP